MCPCRFSDMIQCFRRPVSNLSLITNEVIDFIYDNQLSCSSEQYAETISRKGSLLNNCFGFIYAPKVFIASISLRKRFSLHSIGLE